MKQHPLTWDSINKLKQFYSVEIKKIESETEEAILSREGLIDVMIRHRDMMIQVIRSLLDYMTFPDSIELMISGSFVKGTNLLDSDLDLTFIYPDEKRERFYFFEKKLIKHIRKVTCNSGLSIHSPVTLPAGQVIWDQQTISSIRNKKDLKRYFVKIQKRINLKLCSAFSISRLPVFEPFEFGYDTGRIDSLFTALKNDFISYKFDDSDKIKSINSLLFSITHKDILAFSKAKNILLSKAELHKLHNSISGKTGFTANGQLLLIRNLIEQAYADITPKYIIKRLKFFYLNNLLSQKIQVSIKNQVFPLITKGILRLPQSIEKWNDRSIESVIDYFRNNMHNREWLLGGYILKLSFSELNLKKTVNDILLLEKYYILDKRYIVELDAICNNIRITQKDTLPKFMMNKRIQYEALNSILEKNGHKYGYYLLYNIRCLLIHKYEKQIPEYSFFGMLKNSEIISYIGLDKCDKLHSKCIEFLNIISALHIVISGSHGFSRSKDRYVINNNLIHHLSRRFNYSFKDVHDFKDYIYKISVSMHDIIISIIRDLCRKESVEVLEIQYRDMISSK